MNKKNTLLFLSALASINLWAMEENKPGLGEETYAAMLADKSLAQLTQPQEETTAQLAQKSLGDENYSRMCAQAGDEHTEK